MKKLTALFLALLMLAGLAGCGSSAPAEKDPMYFHSVFYGVFDEDGSAYAPTMDGGVAKAAGEVKSAILTPDRKTLVYLDGGTVYCKDVATGDKTEVASDVDRIFFVRNAGFFYEGNDDNLYRRRFGDTDPLKVGEWTHAIISDRKLNLGYCANNSVYFLGEESDEIVKVGTYNDDLEFFHICDNGTTLLWGDQDGKTETVTLYENGEKFRICDYDLTTVWYTTYSSTRVEFDVSEQYMTIMNTGSDVMYLKKLGEDAMKIKLGDKPRWRYALTSRGMFDENVFDPEGGLYVLIGSDKSNVYWISPQGDREKMVSDVKFLSITSGHIFYRDSDDTLFYGKLDKDKFEPVKIASDVEYGFTPPTDTEYIYYLRDLDDDNCGTLYTFKIGGESPVKVADDVFYSPSFSPDGQTIFYFTDLEKIPDTSTEIGTLYMFSYGDAGPTKIASDVIKGSLDSGISPNDIFKNSFVYNKYSFKKDGTVFFNLMYYNGTASVSLAADVAEEPVKK